MERVRNPSSGTAGKGSLCNEADLMRELKGGKEHLGGSDRNIVQFTLQFEREKLESDVTILQLSKGDCKDMREELAQLIGKGELSREDSGVAIGGVSG
eukprot:g33740.t1